MGVAGLSATPVTYTGPYGPPGLQGPQGPPGVPGNYADAPVDGNAYMRSENGWVSGGTLIDYVTVSSGWVQINDDTATSSEGWGTGYGATLLLWCKNPTDPTAKNIIGGYIGPDAAGWQLHMPDATARTGSNVGANFAIVGLDDTGHLMPPALTIYRGDSSVALNGFLTSSGGGLTLNDDTAGEATGWGPGIYLNCNAPIPGSGYNTIESYFGDTYAGWTINFPDSAPRTGNNAGANFVIHAYDDSGNNLPTALKIERATGNVTLTGDLIAPNVRTLVTAAQTFYLDAATGDDVKGDGSQAKPWATLDRVWAWLNTIDNGGFGHTVNLSAGSFVAAGLFPNVIGGGGLAIVGAGSTLTTLIPNPVYGAIFLGYAPNFALRYNGVTFDLSGGYMGFYASTMSLTLGGNNYDVPTDLVFITAPGGILIYAMNATINFYTGSIEVKQCGDTSGYAISAFYANCQVSDSANWNYTGPPDTLAPCVAVGGGSYVGALAFAGTALGQKFALTSGAQMNSGGVGLGYFVGDQPGIWDATCFYDLVQGGPARRTLLTAAQTLYVAATGNDVTGDGSQAKPWATLTKAYSWFSSIDTGGFNHILNIGPGSFAGGAPLQLTGGGQLQINGAGSTQTTLTVQVNGYAVLQAEGPGATFGLNAVTVDLAESFYGVLGIGCTMIIGDAGFAVPTDMVFKTTPGCLVLYGYSCIFETATGAIEVQQCGDTTGYGSTLAMQDMCAFSDYAHWTFTGPPDTLESCAYFAKFVSFIGDYAWTGTVLGPKFGAIQGCQMDSNSVGLGYFAGSAPGTWDASCFYDGVAGSAALAADTRAARMREQRRRQRLSPPQLEPEPKPEPRVDAIAHHRERLDKIRLLLESPPPLRASPSMPVSPPPRLPERLRRRRQPELIEA
jgi:hypothetical protein